jgi:hypothetical protein
MFLQLFLSYSCTTCTKTDIVLLILLVMLGPSYIFNFSNIHVDGSMQMETSRL